MNCRIRSGIPADAESVAKLERETFPDAWSVDEISDFLQPEFGATRITIVAESAGQLAGFIMARRILDEAQIYNFVVAPEYRRQGIGSQLLDKVLKELRAAGTVKVYLEVRESNLAAQAIYDARGFREVSRRRGYYRQPSEDGLILEKIF